MAEDVLDITIASYLESEWEAWREKAEDGEVTFTGSYAVWRDISETFRREKRLEGYQVRLVEIRLADFLSWAERTGNKTDSAARAAYAAMMADAI
jgi:hypothetical protein